MDVHSSSFIEHAITVLDYKHFVSCLQLIIAICNNSHLAVGHYQ